MAQTSLNAVDATLARLLNRRLRPVIAPMDLTPVQITVVYGFLAFGALYLSDVYLPQAVQDPVRLAQLQALKGGLEVVLTAGVILVLTTRSRRAIEIRNDRLENLRAERGVLHRVFRHNIRHDINVILGYSDLIRENTADAALREHCSRITETISEVEAYQDKIVRIERMLGPQTTVQRIDLVELLRDDPAVETLRDSDDVSIFLDLPEESPVIAVPYIRSAIHEVLENAVEHNDADEPKIWVTIEDNSDELTDLIVADNGPGIPLYERSAIEGLHEEDLTHSSGLGLWFAKLVCRVSGGDLDLPEPHESGGKVVLELPAAYDGTIRRRLSAVVGGG